MRSPPPASPRLPPPPPPHAHPPITHPPGAINPPRDQQELVSSRGRHREHPLRRPRYHRPAGCSVQLLRPLRPEPQNADFPARGDARQARPGIPAAAGVTTVGAAATSAAAGRQDTSMVTARRSSSSASSESAVRPGKATVRSEHNHFGDVERAAAGGPGPPSEAEQRAGIPPRQSPPFVVSIIERGTKKNKRKETQQRFEKRKRLKTAKKKNIESQVDDVRK